MADTHVGCVKRTAFLVLACCLALGFAHGQEGLPVPRGPAGVAVVAKDAKSGQLQPVSLYGKMLALVVGIDDYADSTLNLEYSVRDAKAVAEALRNQFEFSTVLELYNAKATQEAIVGAVMQLVKQAEYNDAVLVFFAGHGTQVGRGENAVGYLIPHDGGPQEEKREWARNISMTTIVDWSRLIRAKHIFYVMDACYSGLMASRAIGETKLPARDLAYLQEMTKEPVRIVLTAGMAGQKVLDGGPKGHSVFTGRFLEALEREKDFMTAMEVAVELKRKVASDALSRGHTQTPDYARLYGLGDFVFVPKQESLEALQTKLQGVQKLIAEIEGRPGSVKAAELERQKAELEARRLAAAKREEVRKQAEAEAAREAEAKAQRQREAQEMRRKLSEEQDRIGTHHQFPVDLKGGLR